MAPLAYSARASYLQPLFERPRTEPGVPILLTAYCLLPTVYCLLFTAYCLQPTLLHDACFCALIPVPVVLQNGQSEALSHKKFQARSSILKEQVLSISEWFYRVLSDTLGYTHPVHPTQINMPIGLVTGALILGLLALFFRKGTLRFSARHCLILALLFLIPTVLSGIMDWQHYFGGIWLFPIKAKVVLGIVLFLLLFFGILLSRRAERRGALVLICFLAFCTSVALGYFGGEMVFGGRAPESHKGNRDGEIVFRNNCSGCHPYGSNTLMPERPVINSHLLTSLTPFQAWLRNPSPPMPPFPSEDIPDGQVQALYDYILEIWAQHPHAEEPAPQQSPLPPSEPPASDQSDGAGEAGPLRPSSTISL